MKKALALILVFVMALGMVACSSNTAAPAAPAADAAPAAPAADAAPAAPAADAAPDAPAADAAPAAPAAEGKSEVNIGVLVWKFSDTYGSSVRTAMTKWAEQIGAEKGVKINLEMLDGNDDQATQNNQAEVLFAKKPDLVIINICDVNAGQELVRYAQEYDVPIMFYNKEPTTTSLITDTGAIFVGTDIAQAGVMEGELLKDIWDAHPEYDRNGDGKVQFLQFMGEVSNPEAIARTEYSEKRAAELGLDLERLTGDSPTVANWDTAQAQDQMRALWANHGDKIEAVFCNNDDMAMGVIAVLNENGWNLGDDPSKFIPIIGVDATDAALEAIRAGKMAASVKQDGDAMGKANIEVALNKALGKDWLDGTGYSIADDGYSIRIPYAKVTE